MTLYPDPPLLYPDCGDRYILADDYSARVDVGGSTFFVDVPAGFPTDGASIPRRLWPVIGHPFAPIRMRAALLHDWIYSSHVLSRRDADVVYREVLIESGMFPLFAWIEWAVLRCAGWMHW